ncbi:hypothetical protein [Micromonospora sp. NPDC000668]|uniref:hypothetical protein n=1 Tax=Micromonospora sp. NPDC000668 TaxID=3364219 RepID=UPI0036A25F0E
MSRDIGEIESIKRLSSGEAGRSRRSPYIWGSSTGADRGRAAALGGVRGSSALLGEALVDQDLDAVEDPLSAELV